MQPTRFLVSSFAAAALAAAASAHAGWQVDNAQSSFHFVTTKAGKPGTAAIEEVQSFKRIAGRVADDGSLQFDVDLASVATNIDLRDQRIKDLLFNVAQHPKASFAATVDAHRLAALPAGGSADLELSGRLTIAGQTAPVQASLRVVKLADRSLLATTRAPIVVNLKDYGLQDGVEALRTVMQLDVLSASAPVSFSVVLRAGG